MALGDTYLLRDVQTLAGQECINTYYYENTNDDGTAEDLVGAFISDVLPDIQAIQHEDLVHESVDAYNLSDSEDFYAEALGATYNGDVGGEVMPKFVAWSYRLNRASRSVRNGHKRYAGVAEAWVADGEPAPSTGNGERAALAATLEAELAPNEGRYELRIPKGPFSPSTIPTPYPIASVSFVGVTTQNSRKR